MSDIGKQKAATYIANLAALEIAEREAQTHPTYFMAYYHNLASAGTGEYLFEDIPTDIIEVPANELSEQAVFVIGVKGDSMEPTFHNPKYDEIPGTKTIQCIGKVLGKVNQIK